MINRILKPIELKAMTSEQLLELRKDICFGNYYRALVKNGFKGELANQESHNLMETLNKLGL